MQSNSQNSSQHTSGRIRWRSLALVCGLVLAHAVNAETASETLTRIEAETLVLKAREKQLDVQASILSKQNEIAAKQTVHDQITQPSVVGDPVIRSIEGIGRKMFATLQMSNGTTLDAQAGDVLSNGMRIISINQNEVIVDAGKRKRVRLSSHFTTVSTFNPGYPSPNVGLPALPVIVPPGGVK